MSDDTIYVATETFAAEVDGHQYQVRKGIDRVRGAHPLYKQTESAGWWAPVTDKVTFDVEQATKEPGEKRGAPALPTIKDIPAVVEADADAAATSAAIAHAKSLGVDLSKIAGTGKDGTITKADVEAAVQA